jgi:hypothetical protein
MIQATTSLTRAESVRDCNGALEVLKPEPGSSCKRHTEPPVHSLPRGAKNKKPPANQKLTGGLCW